jgi:Flp pilus assembly protein TadB
MVTFLAPLVPVLLTILVARGRRGHCDWSLQKANRQLWISVLVIVVVVFIPAVPLSPLALILLVIQVFAVYRLTLALCRKRDLAKIPSSVPSALD